jgi:hypothetical protein
MFLINRVTKLIELFENYYLKKDKSANNKAKSSESEKETKDDKIQFNCILTSKKERIKAKSNEKYKRN